MKIKVRVATLLLLLSWLFNEMEIPRYFALQKIFWTNHYFKKWSLLNNENCSLEEHVVLGSVCRRRLLVTKRCPAVLVCVPDDERWEPLAKDSLAI